MMKKKILLACLLGCAMHQSTMAFNSLNEPSSRRGVKVVSTTSPKDNFAQITFDTLCVNLGKFSAANPVQKCIFNFTNKGTAPLVIHTALASCGCTVPSYSKAPVKPGEKGSVEVTYNGTGKFPGKFSKTVTIRSNAVNEVVRLTVMGEMTD